MWRSPLLSVHRHQTPSKQQKNLLSHQLQASLSQDPIKRRRQLVKLTSPVSLLVLNQSTPRPSHCRQPRKTTWLKSTHKQAQVLRSTPRQAQVLRPTQKPLRPNNLLAIKLQRDKALSPRQLLLSNKIPTNLQSLQLHNQKIKQRDHRWNQQPSLRHQEPR